MGLGVQLALTAPQRRVALAPDLCLPPARVLSKVANQRLRLRNPTFQVVSQ
jgi:hypothetical protein